MLMALGTANTYIHYQLSCVLYFKYAINCNILQKNIVGLNFSKMNLSKQVMEVLLQH